MTYKNKVLYEQPKESVFNLNAGIDALLHVSEDHKVIAIINDIIVKETYPFAVSVIHGEVLSVVRKVHVCKHCLVCCFFPLRILLKDSDELTSFWFQRFKNRLAIFKWKL